MSARLQHGANYLSITTFDGSGDGVHPSILDFGTGILKQGHTSWAGHRYWQLNTPFPNSIATHEYPCVYYSDDGLTWTEAPITSVRGTYESPIFNGVGNPIVHNGFFSPFDTRDFCPDPEVTYDPLMDCIDVNFMFLLGSAGFVGGNNGNYRLSIDTDLVCSVPVRITAAPTLFLRHPVTGAYYGWKTRDVQITEGGVTYKTRVLDRRESTDGGLTWVGTNTSTTLFPWYNLCDMTHSHYNLFLHPDLNTVDFILTTYDAPTYTMAKNAFYHARTYLSDPTVWEFPLGTERVLEPSLNSSDWFYGFQYKPSFTIEGDKLRLWYSLRQGTAQKPNRLGYAEGIIPEVELLTYDFDLDLTQGEPYDFDVDLTMGAGYDFDVDLTQQEVIPPTPTEGNYYQLLCDDYLLHDSRLDSPRVLQPKLAFELNASGSLDFYLPSTHQHYNAPQKRKSVIELWQGTELLFTGQVLNDETDMFRVKKIECEGDFGYFLDSIQRPYDHTGEVLTLLTQVIDAHNAQMTEARKEFTLGFVDVVDPNDTIVRSDSGYSTTLDTLKNKFFGSSLGGYFKTRGTTTRYLDYTVASGVQSSQVIRFGENILDLNRFVRGEDIATAIIPLGAQVDEIGNDPVTGEEITTTKRVTIETVNDGLDYIVDEDAVELYGLIFATQTWDDVTEPENLIQRGYDELAQRKLLNITLELSAVDLHLLDVDIDRLELGDSVRVVSAPHGIDEFMTIQRMELDITDPANNSITLGSQRASLVDSTQDGINNGADEVLEIVRANYTTNEQLVDVKHDILIVSSEIAQSADEILMTVEEQYASKTALTETEDIVSAQIQLNADQVLIKFDEEHAYTVGVEDAFNASQEELSTYIRFDIDGMELGKAGSPFMAELTNEELAFLQNGNKVAYINNNKLYITDAEVVNSLIIGKYAYIPRSNGNTSWKWIGG